MMLAPLCVSFLLVATHGVVDGVYLHGYVVDKYCWGLPGHSAVDGTPLATSPQDHSVACMKMKVCAESGFVLLALTEDSTYVEKYYFDQGGNEQMVALLQSTATIKGMYVRVNGTLLSDTIMEVTSIREMELCTPKRTGTEAAFILHGVIMTYAWLIAAPLSVFFVRYRRDSPAWLTLHRFFAQSTLIGASSASFAYVMAHTTSYDRFSYGLSHNLVGYMIMLLSLTQYILGLLTEGLLKVEQGAKYQFFAKLTHRYVGRMLLSLGLYQCISGYRMMSEAAVILVAVYVSMLVLFFLYMEIAWQRGNTQFSSIQLRRDLHQVCENRRLPSFNSLEFHERVLSGSRWVIVAETVVDIDEWIQVHPGGSKLLAMAIGTDVTQQVLGQKPHGNYPLQHQNMLHTHSLSALRLLQDRCQGKLIADPLVISDTEEDYYKKDDNEIVFARVIYKEILAPSSAPVLSLQLAVPYNEMPLAGTYYEFAGINDAAVFFYRPYTPIDIEHHLQLLKFRKQNDDDEAHLNLYETSLNVGRKEIALQFYIRLYKSGKMSQFLRTLKIGDSNLRISGPHIPPSHSRLANLASAGKDTRLGFIVAGTGVVVLLQQLETLMANNVHVDCLWQVRKKADLFAVGALERHYKKTEHALLSVDYVITNEARPLAQVSRAKTFTRQEGVWEWFRNNVGRQKQRIYALDTEDEEHENKEFPFNFPVLSGKRVDKTVMETSCFAHILEAKSEGRRVLAVVSGPPLFASYVNALLSNVFHFEDSEICRLD